MTTAPTPKTCTSCGAPILWAKVLEKGSEEVKMIPPTCNFARPRVQWAPIDFQPTVDGNVQLFVRPEEGVVARTFAKRADAPPDAILRTNHFKTCPKREKHRRGRRGSR